MSTNYSGWGDQGCVSSSRSCTQSQKSPAVPRGSCSARVLAQGWHRDLRDPVGSACLAPPCADCGGKPESRVNPLKMDTSKN